MGKIDDYVMANKLKPSDCAYHTNRSIQSKSGKRSGNIRVLVHKDSKAMVEYICPECSHSGYAEQPWKRPFSIKCEKCGEKLSVSKLRAQAKKEMKRDNLAESSGQEED